jgi:hypothetical protein
MRKQWEMFPFENYVQRNLSTVQKQHLIDRIGVVYDKLSVSLPPKSDLSGRTKIFVFTVTRRFYTCAELLIW